MSIVLFFSKLNLVSEEIFTAYKDDDVLPRVLTDMSSELKSDVDYSKTQTVDLGSGLTEITKVNYKLNILSKENDCIEGRIYKSSVLHYNILDEHTNELIPQSTPNSECIRFYFDYLKEVIVFHTTNRFGYREFNEALENIINKCMEISEKSYRFTVDLRTEGIAISEFRQKLKEMGNIKELHLKIQPPNVDSELRKRMLENGEEAIDDIVDANVSGMNQLFSSKSALGLNLNSVIIDESISKMEAIDQYLGGNEATGRGYISIEATSRGGKRYTTADAKPKKFEVDNLKEFVNKCRRAINSVL